MKVSAVLALLASVAVTSAWEVTLIGMEGLRHEAKGRSLSGADCTVIPQALVLRQFHFTARDLDRAEIQLFADANCEQKVEENCSGPFHQKVEPPQQVLAYKIR